MTDCLKILVVDDDHDAADSMAELFEMEGHEVSVVYDGDEAIKAYKTIDFDIAFMDIMMPGRNGVESFFEIRKMKPNAKVYMMTGFSVEQLVQQAIEHGAMGVLNKPFAPSKVLSLLDEVSPAGIVLVAEDDPDLGPQLEEVLNDAGHRCKLVNTGEDALKTASSSNVDVLILDLNLPVIDGVEVYTKLQELGKAVPTIIISGHLGNYADAIAAMRDVTVTGVLTKPFDPAVLLSRLDDIAA